MMKPSESAAVMQTDAQGNPINSPQNMHRGFNQTQHVHSEDKVYPGRAHTIDPADLD